MIPVRRRKEEVVVVWDEVDAKAHLTKLLACASAEERAEYLKKNPEWTRLIPLFEHWSYGKCWYSEAMPRKHGAGFDMDHFRPKSAATDPWNGHRDWDGYPWLTYEWTNFRLAAPNTNRPGRDIAGAAAGKGILFPLRSSQSPIATRSEQLAEEDKHLLLIDPCNEHEVCDLSFNDEGRVTCVNDNDPFRSTRVERTVAVYNLNHPGFVAKRQEVWREGKKLVDRIAAWSRAENLDAPGPMTSVVDELRREFALMSRADQEFAGTARAFARSRNEEWVRSLSQNVEPPTYVPFGGTMLNPSVRQTAAPVSSAPPASPTAKEQLCLPFADSSVVVAVPPPKRPRRTKKGASKKGVAVQASPALDLLPQLDEAQEDE